MKFDIDCVLNSVYDRLESGSKRVAEKARSAKFVKRYQESDDPFEKVLEDLSGVLLRSYDAVSGAARPIVQKSADKLHTAARIPYRKAGMPYGDNEEGRQRWQQEQEEVLKTKAVQAGSKVLGLIKQGTQQAAAFTAEKIRSRQQNNDRKD